MNFYRKYQDDEREESKKKLLDDPVIKTENRSISSLAFDRDNQSVLTASFEDRIIKKWGCYGTEKGRYKFPLRMKLGANKIVDFALTKNQKIISATAGGDIRIFDINTMNEIRIQKNVHDSCTAIKISGDEKYLISRGRRDNTVIIWDLERGDRLHTMTQNEGSDDVFNDSKVDLFNHHNSLSISNDNQYFLTGSYKNICVWFIDSCKVKRKIRFAEPFSQSRIVVSCCGTRQIVTETFRSPGIFTSDAKSIISGNNKLEIYDVDSGKLPNFININTRDNFTGLGITSDDQYVTIAQDDITLHDLKSNETSKLEARATQYHIHDSEGHLVSTGLDGSLRFWDFGGILKKRSLGVLSNSEIKNNDSQQILTNFRDIFSDPSLLSVELLNDMWKKVSTIADFNLTYSLTILEIEENKSGSTQLQDSVYVCLKRLLPVYILLGTSDGLLTGETGAINIANYQLILDSAFKYNLITKKEKYFLTSLAQNKNTFSQAAFIKQQKETELLKKQVSINCKNIKILSEDIKDLRTALKKKYKRDILFSLAKIALPFIGAGLVDLFSSMMDLSNLSQFLGALLKIEPQKVKDFFGKGITAVKENMNQFSDSIVEFGAKPDELFDIWLESQVVLESINSNPDFEVKNEDPSPLSSKFSQESSHAGEFRKSMIDLLEAVREDKLTFKFSRSKNSLSVECKLTDKLEKKFKIILKLLENLFNNSVDIKDTSFGFIIQSKSPKDIDEVINMLSELDLKPFSSISQSPLAFLNNLKSTHLSESEASEHKCIHQ